MLLKVKKSTVTGVVNIPGSKSHTIRALFFASLAKGTSTLINPLFSNDAMSAVNVLRAFGAGMDILKDKIIVNGFSNQPQIPDDIIDVGNSGTTLRFAVMMAALVDGYSIFTGDFQIRKRPLGPLINTINNFGGTAFSAKNNGSAPLVIKGIAKGGYTEIDAVTSQYLSSLLINSPLLQNDTEILVTRLNEVPYVEMTLWWLDKLSISYKNNEYKSFFIKGGQTYKPFEIIIPGDFSSATFFMALAAISCEEFILKNLDLSDKQGDKEVLYILENMGAKISTKSNNIIIKGDNLIGIDIDMNRIPDALPAMAVVGCFAKGETRLLNVPQARLKETDRINVMCMELKKLGANIEELPDGLVIRESKLRGARVNGHFDHRVVMALAIAGLCIEGETVIDTAEAIDITFPEFVKIVNSLGGDILHIISK